MSGEIYDIGIDNDDSSILNNRGYMREVTSNDLSDVISEFKDVIYWVSKRYKNNDLVLYTSDVHMTPDEYIENYTRLYGSNSLSERDKELIFRFNRQ